MMKIGLGKNLANKHYYSTPTKYTIPANSRLRKGDCIPGYGSFITAVFSQWCKDNNIVLSNLLASLKLMILTGELVVLQQDKSLSPSTTKAVSVSKGVNISNEAADGLYTICSPLGFPLNDKYHRDMIVAYMELLDTTAKDILKQNANDPQ